MRSPGLQAKAAAIRSQFIAPTVDHFVQGKQRAAVTAVRAFSVEPQVA